MPRAETEKRATIVAGFGGDGRREDGVALARALEPLTCAQLELAANGRVEVPDPYNAGCLVVLGSSEDGADHSVGIGRLGESLLYGGACSVAVAPKGFSERERHLIATVGVYWEAWEEAETALEAANHIAGCAGGSVQALDLSAPADVDLLVIASASYAPKQRVLLDEGAEWLVRSATCPVLVLPRRSR